MSDALPWIAQACVALPGIAALVAAARSARTAKAENRELLSRADLNAANAQSTRAQSFVDTENRALENALKWREALERRDLAIDKLDHDLGELRRARESERLDAAQRIQTLEQLLEQHGIPLP